MIFFKLIILKTNRGQHRALVPLLLVDMKVVSAPSPVSHTILLLLLIPKPLKRPSGT